MSQHVYADDEVIQVKAGDIRRQYKYTPHKSLKTMFPQAFEERDPWDSVGPGTRLRRISTSHYYHVRDLHVGPPPLESKMRPYVALQRERSKSVWLVTRDYARSHFTIVQ